MGDYLNAKNIVVTIFVVGFAILYFWYCGKLKNKKMETMVACEKKRDFKAAYKISDEYIVRFLFGAKTQARWRLNYALATEDDNLIDTAFSKFSKLRMLEPAVMADVCSRAFDYYVSIRDLDKIKFYHGKLMATGDEALRREIDAVYNTYFQDGAVYLDYKLSQIKMIKPAFRAPNEFLISKMYENLGDKENAEKYERLANKHARDLRDSSMVIDKTNKIVTKRHQPTKSVITNEDLGIKYND